MKITSHLHKTITVTEEEANRISLPVIIRVKGHPWIQYSTVNTLQNLPRGLLTTTDSFVKPLSSEKPDDLTGTWMQQKRRQGNTHRMIWCNLHITTSEHVNTPDEERLQLSFLYGGGSHHHQQVYPEVASTTVVTNNPENYLSPDACNHHR